ncbi:MAG: PQQ-binding-like beta-propeller repeat protein [Clostridiales bacterium]|nr:PQQ-binding-like beta-propeller repeat protein [Clostridiales bacterium]
MKKTLTFLFFIFLFLALTTTGFKTKVVEGDLSGDWWPMFGHDLTNARHSTSPAPRTNMVAWTYTATSAIRSAAIVQDGVVYVGAFSGDFYALNATTGDLIWTYETDGGIWSSAAVANGMVYFTCKNFNIYALNATTGILVWSFTTGDETWSSPVVYASVVYFGANDNIFYALNATTGEQVWSFTTGGHIRSSPAIVDGVVYISSQDGYLYALNADSGTQIWRSLTRDGDIYTNSSPAVAGGLVYIGSTDGHIYAFSTANGAQMWNYTTGDKVSSSPAVLNGIVYVGSEDERVYALNANTGTFIWSRATGSSVFSSPAIADGVVYIGSYPNGIVYALDASTGDNIWQFTTGGGVFSSPSVVNGIMYVGSYDNILYAFGSHIDPNGSSTPIPEVWVPPPSDAAVATVITVAVTGVVSVAVAVANSAVGAPTSKVAKEVGGLLPSAIKKWLASFLASKRKLIVDEKRGYIFLPTKPELLAYAISIVLLAFSFSYVKVSSLGDVLTVLPTIFATSILVGFAKSFVTITYARHRGVWTEFKLWYFGLAIFIITTFAFKVPFSSPTRNVNYAPKMTKQLSAKLSIFSILITLVFAGLFFVLLLTGNKIIGGTGLAMCLIGAFFDTFPIAPLYGKKIFDYSKPVWTALFVSTLAFYIAWLFLI